MIAAGIVNPAMVVSIKQKKAVTIAYFKPGQPDPSEYTDKDGNMDTGMKKSYDGSREWKLKGAAETHIRFEEDWKRMYHRGKAQVCPETLQRMMRCDNWKSIEEKNDLGEFMELLEIVCLHGNDKEYRKVMAENEREERPHLDRDIALLQDVGINKIVDKNEEVESECAAIPEDETSNEMQQKFTNRCSIFVAPPLPFACGRE